MGTRNLTCVVLDGEYKVAQYGQWDGYPEGQGRTILEFLSQEGAQEQLKLALKRCRFLDIEGNPADKAFADDHDERAPKSMGDPDRRTPEQVKWFCNYISRDIGGSILENIATLITDDCLKRNPAITYLLSKTSLPITQLNEKRAALGLPRFCV